MEANTRPSPLSSSLGVPLRQWRQAWRASWYVLSFVGLVLVAAPWVVTPGPVDAWVPACEARLRGGSCVLCGMTSSFFALRHGDFAAASAAHRAGPILYISLALNGVAAVIGMTRRLRVFRVTAQEDRCCR